MKKNPEISLLRELQELLQYSFWQLEKIRDAAGWMPLSSEPTEQRKWDLIQERIEFLVGLAVGFSIIILLNKHTGIYAPIITIIGSQLLGMLLRKNEDLGTMFFEASHHLNVINAGIFSMAFLLTVAPPTINLLSSAKK